MRLIRIQRDAPQPRFALAAFVALVLFVGTYLAFVWTEIGQTVENLALRGAELRSEASRTAALEGLTQISVVSLALAIASIFLVAVLRRRPGLGVLAGAIISGSVVIAELMKEILPRPVLVEGAPWILRNSFPSGTAAVAVAIAVGALLVTPDRLRWLAVSTGALYTGVLMNAIQTAGWHRLSDTLGSTFLVFAVASAGATVLAWRGLVQPSVVGRIDRRVRYGLAALASAMLLVATVMLVLLIAFPILGSPEGARRAFLQGAFPLFGAGLGILGLLAFARLIEPFALGRSARATEGTEPAADSHGAGAAMVEPLSDVVDRATPSQPR